MRHFPVPLLILLSLFNCPVHVAGQGKWPTPELQQMYTNAREYTRLGNFSDAVITCKQALLLAPDKMVFYKEMGQAQYLWGKYKDAEESLASLKNTPDADTVYYRLLGACKVAQGKIQNAIDLLTDGTEKFPASGNLHYELGSAYLLKKAKQKALDEWQRGMKSDPGYPPNYYAASRLLLETDKVVWGLLFGEIYLTMPHDTSGDDLLKKELFVSWKTFFDHVADENTRKGITLNTSRTENEFQTAVLKTYVTLTPIVSDGITTENLVMVRTRFLMDWISAYQKKFEFPLFSYLNMLVANGRFEIYNEWMFGNAENKEQFDAWNKFHEGDIARFEEWKAAHPFHPTPRNFDDKPGNK